LQILDFIYFTHPTMLVMYTILKPFSRLFHSFLLLTTPVLIFPLHMDHLQVRDYE